MLRTRITDLFRIEHPIILAGMSGNSDVDLVVAVSEAGGLGILGASGWSPDVVAAKVAAVRARTRRPFGVNRLLVDPDPSARAERMRALLLALEGGASVLSTAWGTPQELSEIGRAASDAGIPLMHMVTTATGAVEAALAGATVIVAQGHEGGGHVGSVATMAIVPSAVDALARSLAEERRPPIVAAGGIADGRGLAAALALGAEGVLVGTRFLVTPEANLSAAAKAAMAAATESDTMSSRIYDLVRGPHWVEAGAYCRTIRSRALESWIGREDDLAAMDRPARDELADRWRTALDAGQLDDAAILAGQACGLIHGLLPAGEVVRRIAADAEAVLGRLRRFAPGEPVGAA